MSELDLKVKKLIAKAETDSSLKASIEWTMGANWYSKALFQMLSRKYRLADFTRLSEVFYQITGIQPEVAFNIGKKILSKKYCISTRDPYGLYLACEGYAVIISSKRKVINNE